MNWKTMPEGREKYQAYLCSENWGWRRAAVKERCGGVCEKCNARPMSHVHHQTYIRKYAELLTDLIGICEPCHSEIHCVRAPVQPEPVIVQSSWVTERLRELDSNGVQFPDPRVMSLLKIATIRLREKCKQYRPQWIELQPTRPDSRTRKRR